MKYESKNLLALHKYVMRPRTSGEWFTYGVESAGNADSLDIDEKSGTWRSKSPGSKVYAIGEVSEMGKDVPGVVSVFDKNNSEHVEKISGYVSSLRDEMASHAERVAA